MFKKAVMGLGAGLLIASGAYADDKHMDVTAYFTQRADGGFRDVNKNDLNVTAKSGLAVSIGWPASEHGSEYELLYSKQSTKTDGAVPIDLKIEYLQIGGTAIIGNESSHVVPYAAGGLGATRFTPSAGLTQETRWAVSLGGGVRIPVAQRVQVRIEARGYLTWLNGSSNLFCNSGASTACALNAKGQTFFQYEALGGVTFGF
jgi:hypothetical protein